MAGIKEKINLKSSVNKGDRIANVMGNNINNTVASDLMKRIQYEEQAKNSLEEHIKNLEKSNSTKKHTRGNFSNWSPNPKRLIDIRKKIQKYRETLSSLQNSKHPNNSKRNKKKYVLRISRLRSKELHEENKIKLSGLVVENTRLEYYIDKTKRYLQSQIFNAKDRQHLLEKTNMTLDDRVAGNFKAFIDEVLTNTLSNQKNTVDNGEADSVDSEDMPLCF